MVTVSLTSTGSAGALVGVAVSVTCATKVAFASINVFFPADAVFALAQPVAAPATVLTSFMKS